MRLAELSVRDSFNGNRDFVFLIKTKKYLTESPFAKLPVLAKHIAGRLDPLQGILIFVWLH
jgi:hypothetical protein